jgi:hypothetical protein
MSPYSPHACGVTCLAVSAIFTNPVFGRFLPMTLRFQSTIPGRGDSQYRPAAFIASLVVENCRLRGALLGVAEALGTENHPLQTQVKALRVERGRRYVGHGTSDSVGQWEI